MASSAHGPPRYAAIAGLLALALATAPAILAGEHSALQIQSVRLEGDRLVILVANPGERSAHGKLIVRVAVDSDLAETTLRLTVPGGETTLVELRSPAPGEEMTPLGVILDDGSPF